MELDRTLIGFAAALGGGLLIGIERERRQGFGARRALAGVRTFALSALSGAAAGFLDEPLLAFAGALLIAALAAIGHWRERSRDPGVTTELALFATYLIGIMAIHHPVIAAAGAIVIASLLAARGALHEFSVEVLTETELRDGLLLAAVALIVLPLLPDAPSRWLAGGSPRRLCTLVVTFMALQAAGYVALRMAGPKLGLSLSGLLAGFVSSTGTIASLGSRARTDPQLLGACVSGALFSTVATVVLLAIVVIAVHSPALATVLPSLAASLVTALGAAGLSLWRQRGSSAAPSTRGRAFNLLHAVGFAAILSGLTALMALVNTRYGQAAAELTGALAGFFDVHAAAASTLSLAASGALGSPSVLMPILIAFSTNTVSKLAGAFVAGGARYGLPVAGGLLAVVAAAWLPLLWGAG